MPFGETRPAADAPVVQVQVADRTPYIYDVRDGNVTRGSAGSARSGTSSRFASNLRLDHKELPAVWHHTASYLDLGILRDTLVPNIALQSGVSVAAWVAGRTLNRADAQTWLWPGGILASAWWAGVGRSVFSDGRSLSNALTTLSWPERLFLAGVTLSRGRQFVRSVAKSFARKDGSDEPRLEAAKKQDGFWTRSLYRVYLPAAALQAVVALPVTAPFRHQGGVLTGYHPYVQLGAVALWGTGFGLQVLADAGRDLHEARGNAGAPVDGVFSIVRHPDSLGTLFTITSIPLLLYASDMLAPLELLGTLTQYLLLRHGTAIFYPNTWTLPAWLGGSSTSAEQSTSTTAGQAPQTPVSTSWAWGSSATDPAFANSALLESEAEVDARQAKEALTGAAAGEKASANEAYVNAFWPHPQTLLQPESGRAWALVLGLGAVAVAVERGLWIWHMR